MAMGQNPNRLPPSEHPNPTAKIGSKMGGEFTYPKMVPLVLTHCAQMIAIGHSQILSEFTGGINRSFRPRTVDFHLLKLSRVLFSPAGFQRGIYHYWKHFSFSPGDSKRK